MGITGAPETRTRPWPALVVVALAAVILASASTAIAQEDENLVPSKDRPGFFVRPDGELVDEFGLMVRFLENESVCVRCHYEKEKYEKLVLDWDASKHSKSNVTCGKCHGGNPKGKDLGEAKNVKTTDFTSIKTPLAQLSQPEVHQAAFRYCGQCHGTQFRDWKVGIHGKRTGLWNGEKEYWICVRCHEPHNPYFKKIEPMPAPTPPAMITLKNAPPAPAPLPPGLVKKEKSDGK